MEMAVATGLVNTLAENILIKAMDLKQRVLKCGITNGLQLVNKKTALFN